MKSGDVNHNYGYLLGTVNLVRREVRSGADSQAIVEAVEELVFRKSIGEMLKEFNLK